MREIIKSILDKNAVNVEFHDAIVDEIMFCLAAEGYIRIDTIKLDTEKMACCVAKALDEMSSGFPFIIEG